MSLDGAIALVAAIVSIGTLAIAWSSLRQKAGLDYVHGLEVRVTTCEKTRDWQELEIADLRRQVLALTRQLAAGDKYTGG
jgi:hypothetical protein